MLSHDEAFAYRTVEPMHLYIGRPGDEGTPYWADLGVVEDVEMTSFGAGEGTRATVTAYQKPRPVSDTEREQREAEDLTVTEPGAAGW